MDGDQKLIEGYFHEGEQAENFTGVFSALGGSLRHHLKEEGEHAVHQRGQVNRKPHGQAAFLVQRNGNGNVADFFQLQLIGIEFHSRSHGAQGVCLIHHCLQFLAADEAFIHGRGIAVDLLFAGFFKRGGGFEHPLEGFLAEAEAGIGGGLA